MPDLNGGTTDVPTPAEGIVEVKGNVGDHANMPAQDAVQAWLFQSGRPPTAVALDTVPALVAADEHFVWVDLASYGEVDLRAVADTLSLHRGAVRAALASWHRPRLSIYPSHFFVSATVAVLDPDRHRVEARELDLFAGKNFLVTAHKRPLPFADHLATRAHTSPELVAMDASFMLYLVLDETLTYYEELNRHLQAEVELLEERALRDPTEASSNTCCGSSGMHMRLPSSRSSTATCSPPSCAPTSHGWRALRQRSTFAIWKAAWRGCSP